MMSIVEIENLLSSSQAHPQPEIWDSHPIHEEKDQQDSVPMAVPPHLHQFITSALDYVRQAQSLICEKDMRIRHLEETSTTDELTGLWNKRGFVLMAQKMFALSRYYGESGIVALVEVEKRTTDTYYDENSDDTMKYVMRQASAILLTRFPDPCVVARIDDNIFGIVLPTHSGEDVRLLMTDEIKQSINEASAMYYDQSMFRLNLGIADYHPTSMLEDVLETAELRMEQSRIYQRQPLQPSLEEAVYQRYETYQLSTENDQSCFI